jgi:hypothetical protein
VRRKRMGEHNARLKYCLYRWVKLDFSLPGAFSDYGPLLTLKRALRRMDPFATTCLAWLKNSEVSKQQRTLSQP